MRTFIRILGWFLLVIGMVATANNVTFMAMGAPGRLGFVVFGILIVLVGLWMARLPKSPVEVKGSDPSARRRSLSNQGDPAEKSNSSKEPEQHTAGRSLQIIECPHCATRVVPMADGICPSCRQPIELKRSHDA